MKRSQIVGCLALLAAFTVAVHAPFGRADFTLDDHVYVVGNQSIRSLPEALSAFDRPFPPEKPERGLYRPLTNLSYAIDFALWGDEPRGFHASNVALYALVVALTFALAFAYSGSSGFALAVGLPGILAVHFLAFGRRAGEEPRRSARRGAVLLAPFAAVAVAYLALRVHALDGFAPLRSAASSGGWSRRILSIGLAFFENVRLLVWPATLHLDFYWERPFVFVNYWVIESGIGWLLLGVALSVFAREIVLQIRGLQPDDTRSTALCALASFLGFLFPVSHVLPIGVAVAERLLFAPSFGFCILAVLAARECVHRLAIPAPSRDRIAALLVAVVAVAGGVRSHLRALDWRDELRLWLGEERVMPHDPRVLANLAMTYFKRDRFEESRDALARARRSQTRRFMGLEPVLDEIDRMLKEEAERR